MNPICITRINSDIIDDFSCSTSDVLLGEVEELEPICSLPWQGSKLSIWPFLIAENVAALESEDAVPLELAPLIQDERSPGHSQILLVTFAIPEKSDHFFTYLSARTTTSPYIVVQDRFEPSPRQTRFSPDFYAIKKRVASVIWRTRDSLIEKKQTGQILRNIPITISPQVVREAEERSLTDNLESSIKLAQENYSTLESIDINIEHDPEIVDRKTIQFTLTVSGEPELVLKDEFKFKDKLYSALDIKTCEQITTTYKWKS